MYVNRVYISSERQRWFYAATVAETRTSYLVGRADRVLRAELERFLEDTDITLNEVTTLSVLMDRPGLSNARLARRALVTPQAMHKVIRRLESAGLVQRVGSPAGGRSLETTVTARGRRVLAEAEAEMDAAESSFLDPLNVTERGQLRTLLLKVARVDGQPPS